MAPCGASRSWTPAEPTMAGQLARSGAICGERRLGDRAEGEAEGLICALTCVRTA